jgi:L-2-hydroxycarboxylate dehydrogenase (NAD+)
VGLLAGTLNGAAMGKDVVDFNHDQASATNTGQAIVAIDIAAFGDVGAFKARVDALVRDLRGSRRMPGVERIWLPGEQSQAKRIAYARDGIPIAAGLMRNLNQLATELGIAALA